MKTGDLVRYNDKMTNPSGRVGVLVEVYAYESPPEAGMHLSGLPMAIVHWSGIEGTMKHRQDLLEVISESR